MENNIQKPWWRDGVILFSKVSAYIAFPIIIASIVGNFLDKKYNKGPYVFFISIGIAFLCTIFLIGREAQIYRKSLKNEEQNK